MRASSYPPVHTAQRNCVRVLSARSLTARVGPLRTGSRLDTGWATGSWGLGRARAQAEEKDIRLRLFKISTQDRTHANKPRNEHTNADTKALRLRLRLRRYEQIPGYAGTCHHVSFLAWYGQSGRGYLPLALPPRTRWSCAEGSPRVVLRYSELICTRHNRAGDPIN